MSQVSTGEDNGLRIKAYAADGAVLWDQENPNYLNVYRYGEPRQTLMRAHGNYLSESATQITRLPSGHQEGYLEAFANVYQGAFEAIRAELDGKPMKATEYKFPTVYDGLRARRNLSRRRWRATRLARCGWTCKGSAVLNTKAQRRHRDTKRIDLRVLVPSSRLLRLEARYSSSVHGNKFITMGAGFWQVLSSCTCLPCNAPRAPRA